MNDDAKVWAWLASDGGNSAIAAVPAAPSAAQISALRREFGGDQVRIAAEASRARAKALLKLDREWAQGIIADVAGVEMASSAIAARHKARRFVDALGEGSRIADLCCGIGGDSWGFKTLGLHPVGVDSDPRRVGMYRHNLGCEAVCGEAVDDCPRDIAAFHLDPARRNAGGTRTRDIEDFLPGPGEWDRLISRHGSGAIKLNPGVNAQSLPKGECEILSEPGGLTQSVLWVGALAGSHERRATKLGAGGGVCSIAGEADRPEDGSVIEGYIGTLDPCLERADLVGSFLDRAGVSLVHPGTGLVTAGAPDPHPMVRWYRVEDSMIWSRKRVKAALRTLGAGVVEIRTRGGVIDPDLEQKHLRGQGPGSGWAVLIYRINGRVRAIIGERMDDEKKTPRQVVARGATEPGHD